MKHLILCLAISSMGVVSAIAQTVTFGTATSFQKTGVTGNVANGTYNPATGNSIIPGASTTGPVFVQNTTTGADLGQLNLTSDLGFDVRSGASLGVFGMGASDDGVIYGGPNTTPATLVRWNNEAAVPTTATISAGPSGGVHFIRTIGVSGTGASKLGVITGSQDNGGFQIISLAEPFGTTVAVLSENGTRALNSGIGKSGADLNVAGDAVWASTIGSSVVKKATRAGTVWTQDAGFTGAGTGTAHGITYDQANNVVFALQYGTTPDKVIALHPNTGAIIGTHNLTVDITSNGQMNTRNLAAGSGTVGWNARDTTTITTGDYGQVAYTYTPAATVSDWFVY